MKLWKLLTLSLALPLLAQAEDAPPPAADQNRLDRRQDNQQKRIDAGVENGSLTKREARHLERQQKRIGKAEARAEADGQVNRKEARHLRNMQNHASRDIYRKKHNRRR